MSDWLKEGSWGSGMTIDLFEPEQRKVVVSLFSPPAITDDHDAALTRVDDVRGGVKGQTFESAEG